MGTIGILVFDGLEELDAVGPWEVLAAWTRQWPDDGWSVTTIAADGGLVTCAKGLVLQAAHSWADAPPLDVLIQPGGDRHPRAADRRDVPGLDPGPAGRHPAAGQRLHRLAGVRRGRAARGPAGDDALGARWTGSRSSTPASRSAPTTGTSTTATSITAAGVSAGIDMALHLVDRLAGTERAREVRRYIQYDPAPPV